VIHWFIQEFGIVEYKPTFPFHKPTSYSGSG
jgi:hypothetical protein